MTVLPRVAHCGVAWLTAGLDRCYRLDHGAHRAVHGELPSLSAQGLVDLAEAIQLRGRGGAGFPFGRKLRAVLRSAAAQRTGTVVVVNAAEGEPASWKDKVLLTRAPHVVLDGAAIAAEATAATQIVVGVAGSGVGAVSLLDALAERPMPAPTRVVAVPHRFISGEAGALVNAINGEAPLPPGQKRFASDSGVAGLPTLLSNAETYAHLAVAARLGAGAYGSVGAAGEPGTVLLSVGGASAQRYVIEAPTGIALREVLRLCDAPVGPGVLMGGFHGSWLTPSAVAQAQLSRAGLAAVGGTLGAGIILALGEGTCPLGEASRVAQYLAGESAGQCGPCRRGLPDLARTLADFVSGTSGSDSLDTIRRAAGAVRGRGACSHPDGTARFVVSALETFGDDVTAHVRHGGCGQPVLGVLPVPVPVEGAGRLSVDWTRCDGHGLCGQILPELIRIDDNGYPAFPDAPVPDWLQPVARKAVAMCPALALRLTAPPARR